MTVGKPNFDLNSFGVKYLSKDQVQDFLEINKFGKNIGDTPDPVEETTDKDGNVIQKKPHPQKEVFTDIKGLNPHQNPTAIDGGGYPGKWRRTGKKDKDGKPIKYQQTEEGTKPKVGQVPTSRKNDVQYGKLGEESTSEVRESFDMITNSPKYQEEIHRDAPLTEKEGTEKFDDTPANRALRDKIAMRNHKKKLAAEKKKKLKKANDIIMNMNIMKLDLMKRSGDLNTYGGFGDVLPTELKQDFQGQSTAERIGEKGKVDTKPTPEGKGAPKGTGNTDKKDIDKWEQRYDKIKNPHHSWRDGTGFGKMSTGNKAPADLKRKAAETIFKAISLKLDLMKDSKDGKQSKDGLPIRNGELKDLISGDDTREHVAEATRLGNEKRDIDEEFKKRYGFRMSPKNLKRFGRKNRMSGGTKESLKSDLMKDALDPKAKPQEDLLGNPNTALPKNTRVGQKPPKVIDMGDSEMDYGTGEQFGNPFHESTTRPTAQGIKNQNKPRYQSTDPNAKYYKNSKVGSSKTDPHKPRSADGKNTYKSAEETIFKATSLKLDLMKDAPKDLEREGIKKRPSNMPKAGKRDFEITPDQEEAARRGDFGNPITGHDKESAMTRLSDSERDWKAGHENAYGTIPINNPEGELIPPSVHNQRMGSTTKMKDEN